MSQLKGIKDELKLVLFIVLERIMIKLLGVLVLWNLVLVNYFGLKPLKLRDAMLIVIAYNLLIRE